MSFSYKIFLPVLVILALSVSSCVNQKKVIYFNGLGDTTFKNPPVSLEPVIQPNDILSISVSSRNPEATLIFNTPNVTPGSNQVGLNTPSQLNGYLVNKDSTIDFPFLGAFPAAGLSKKQLSDSLRHVLVANKLLIDPIVTVRFLNFRVTVLGEVARPGVLNVPSEKMSILEALGVAGDLTIYAKRDNVVLVREQGGEKQVKRINLNSSEILTSPYYYLKTNDVIYVEPSATKIASASTTRQLLPLLLSGLSFFAIIIDRVLRK